MLNILINFSWEKNINQERGGGGGEIWISNLIYTPAAPSIWYHIQPKHSDGPAKLFGNNIPVTFLDFFQRVKICTCSLTSKYYIFFSSFFYSSFHNILPFRCFSQTKLKSTRKLCDGLYLGRGEELELVEDFLRVVHPHTHRQLLHLVLLTRLILSYANKAPQIQIIAWTPKRATENNFKGQEKGGGGYATIHNYSHYYR